MKDLPAFKSYSVKQGPTEANHDWGFVVLASSCNKGAGRVHMRALRSTRGQLWISNEARRGRKGDHGDEERDDGDDHE